MLKYDFARDKNVQIVHLFLWSHQFSYKYSMYLLIQLIVLHKLLPAETTVWTGCEN